jgi:hypothetical protein
MLTKTEEISRKDAKERESKNLPKTERFSGMALQRNAMKMLLKDPRENV